MIVITILIPTVYSGMLYDEECIIFLERSRVGCPPGPKLIFAESASDMQR